MLVTETKLEKNAIGTQPTKVGEKYRLPEKLAFGVTV